MLPIRDLNPRERHAVVTWTLIAINLGVWIFAWLLGPGGAQALVVSTNNRSFRRSPNSAQHVALGQMPVGAVKMIR